MEEPLRTIIETFPTKRRSQPVSISIYVSVVKSACMGVSASVLIHGLTDSRKSAKNRSTYLHEPLMGASSHGFPATPASLGLLQYPLCLQCHSLMGFLLRTCNQDTGQF